MAISSYCSTYAIFDFYYEEDKMKYSTLKSYLDEADTLALFMHRNPDGDCIGSALALGTLLEQQWKHVHYFSPTPPSKNFHFFSKAQEIKQTFDYGNYDIIICVDSANPHHMLGIFRENQEAYFAKKTIINIDHHISNSQYGTVNIVDASASSACELLTEIIQEIYSDVITPEIASYLFMGVSTDTGNFTYDKDSIRTFHAASYLLEQWADKARIIQHLYRAKSYDQVKSMWFLLERMTKKWPIIYSRYTKEDLETYKLDKEQIESFLPLMSSIEHDGIFALFKTSSHDLNPLIRCSLRANTPAHDVSHIAGHFNGWWHQAAAGCSQMIERDFHTTMKEMIKKMEEII